jgi:hypothetical protein
MNGNLPGAPFRIQPVLIQPDYTFIHPHQIFEISPPVIVGSPTWVIVSYPQAHGGFGHQGARMRLFNDAAVYRADTNQWVYYDATGTPGYVGAAPIIRPLTLVPAPVVCPGTGVLENELNCGLPVDTINGGCNSTPAVFFPLTCGDTVCGTAEFDGTNRDTDWYELSLPGTQQIEWSARAEFDAQLLVLEQDPMAAPCAGFIIHGNVAAPAFQTASITLTLPAGTYWLFIAPVFTQPIFPCGLEYTATIECCVVTCAPGHIIESEPCGTDANGGCNSPLGGFEPAQCGTTICGELYAAPGGAAGPIDEDWYEVTIPDLNGDAMGFFVLTINAAMPVQLELHDTSCSMPFPVVFNAIVAPACTPTQLFAGVPAPGSFHIVVRPDVATGYPCGGLTHYTLEIDAGPDCPGGPGSVPNDLCSNAQLIAPAAYTFDNTGATTDGPPSPCGLTGLPGLDADIWYAFVLPCNAIAIITVTGSTLDVAGAVYDSCPPAGSELACLSATAGAFATMTAHGAAGQQLWLRLGGLGGQQGIGSFDITYACTCPADCAQPPDGSVNVSDLLALLAQWPPQTPAGCDINMDGVVDITDLLLLLAAWGSCP